MNVFSLEDKMPKTAMAIARQAMLSNLNGFSYKTISNVLIEEANEDHVYRIINDNSDVIADLMQKKENLFTAAFDDVNDFIAHELHEIYYKQIEAYKRKISEYYNHGRWEAAA